jgi:hypothetical protein
MVVSLYIDAREKGAEKFAKFDSNPWRNYFRPFEKSCSLVSRHFALLAGRKQ